MALREGGRRWWSCQVFRGDPEPGRGLEGGQEARGVEEMPHWILLAP